MLTFCRVGSLVPTKWEEIDLKKDIWTIPGERMKTVDKDDRRALRREFQGWFSTPWNDIHLLWLEHFQEWEDEKCQ